MSEDPATQEGQRPGAGMQPVHVTTAQVRRIYDRLAPNYDRWTALFESKARDRALEIIAAQGTGRILEVAVGPGSAFARILGRNPPEAGGVAVGLDISPKMLAKAAESARKSGNASHLLLQADARHLPFPGESFDVVTNSYMLDLLPVDDIRDALSEYMRVLRPGGRLVLVNMTQSRSLLSRTWEWLYRRRPTLLAGCRGVFASPFLEELGFEAVHREVVVQLSFPSEVVEATKPAA